MYVVFVVEYTTALVFVEGEIYKKYYFFDNAYINGLYLNNGRAKARYSRSSGV